MITVNILIDGKQVFSRSAKRSGKAQGDMICYQTKDEKTIYYVPNEGPIRLAMKILGTVDESWWLLKSMKHWKGPAVKL